MGFENENSLPPREPVAPPNTPPPAFMPVLGRYRGSENSLTTMDAAQFQPKFHGLFVLVPKVQPKGAHGSSCRKLSYTNRCLYILQG